MLDDGDTAEEQQYVVVSRSVPEILHRLFLLFAMFLLMAIVVVGAILELVL